ncbi:MAG: oxygenase MpaB family protein, partial [Nocardioidaceae bacterium]
ALLLQCLHPLAPAGVEDHSDYRDDPWTRVQNTSAFIAATTFGPIEHAEQVIAAVRRVHQSDQGIAPDGRVYSAEDPHLLRWVHIAEVESFLTTFQHYGGRRRQIVPADADTYVAQAGVTARPLGVAQPPTTQAQLHAEIEAFRGELVSTQRARKVARFLLLEPPLPWTARPGYALRASGAVATLPVWARSMLGLPSVPHLDALVGRRLGRAATAAVRWLMADSSVAQDA